MSNPQLPPQTKYWVTHQGDRQGPFDLEFIEAMVMAQVYPATVQVWAKGFKDWLPLNSVINSASIITIQGNTAPSNSASPQAKTRKLTKPKNKFETILPWALVIFCVVFVMWIVNLVSSSKTTKKTLVQSDVKPPVASQPSTVSRPSAEVSTTKQPNTPPLVIRPKVTGNVFKDASGRSYSVPDLAYQRLVALRSDLAVKKNYLDQEDSRLQKMSDQLALDRSRLNTNSGYEVDAFNRRINELNDFSRKVQGIVNTFNREVDDFNTELQRVGTPIN
jgi:hypothetical protein